MTTRREPRRLITCAHCSKERLHIGRGLCGACLQGWNGCDPIDYERRTWPAAELVEEYELLAKQGYTRRTAAERLGVPKSRLDRAIRTQARRQAMAS